MKALEFLFICLPFFAVAESPPVVQPVAISIAGKNVDSPAIWIAPKPEESLVFLTEKKGGSVMVFKADKKATFLKRIGGMKRPNGIAVLQDAPFDETDLLFVTDRDANRIHIYSVPDFQKRATFGEGIPQPMGIALYQGRWDYVVYAYVVFKRAEGDARVVRFRIVEEDGKFSAIREIQFGKELAAGQESIFVDPERQRVLVADENERDIKVYDLDGRYETKFGEGKFESQVKGIAIAQCARDYIIASDQQAVTEFEFFDRATYSHLGTVRGKASNTDGIALTNFSLPDFPGGLFVAQSDPDESGGHHAEFYDFNQLLFAAGLPSCSAPVIGRIPNPKLVLVLVIDQMRYDYLTRFGALFTGGFKRLMDHGAVFSNARYRHAATETGPGHSVILTGRHPSHTGIVANSWYDRFLQRSINVVEDTSHSPVGGQGKSVSPANLIGPTLGDLLKKQTPKSKVVAVSLKDRSAILLAGHRGDAAYWYERNGTFITSSHYADRSPAWLDEWNKTRPVERYAGKLWERLRSDPDLYQKYAGSDQVTGEWESRDTVFPHRIHTAPPHRVYYDDFRRFPFADELTFELACLAMKEHQIGTDDDTDIFAIGFSATDIIGHTYGPDSQELLDHLLRLDGLLERLFQYVEENVGLSNTLVVMTADHGVMPLAEILNSRGIQAKRLRPTVLEIPVIQALQAKHWNPYDLISYFDQPHFYLNSEAMLRNGIQRDEVEDVIKKALQKTGLVDSVYTQSDFIQNEASNDKLFELHRNSFFAPRSPDIIIVLKPYIYLEDYSGGTGHGTPHEYDRHVPIVFLGAAVSPGNYSKESGPEDIAPTLGWLLGIPIPAEKDSRILTEVLSEDASQTLVKRAP